MVCYNPNTAVFPATVNNEGKRPLIFSRELLRGYDITQPIVREFMNPENILGFKIKVPCGKCIGCRMDNARMWALRSVHESRLHTNNCFLTLTFNDKHLPDNNSIDKVYIRQFLKRFRYFYGNDIKYLLCGEYGSKHGRPHYHILFFNFDFADKYCFQYKNGVSYFRSPHFEKKVWIDEYGDSLGFSVIGDVNFESSAYVARYILKKINGCEESEKIYQGREKEFRLNSINFGFDYFVKYYKDIINNGYCIIDNKNKRFKVPIPRYYVEKLKTIDEEFYNKRKSDCYEFLLRTCQDTKHSLDFTYQRLQAREELKRYQLDKLVRTYELEAFLHNIYYNYISNNIKYDKNTNKYNRSEINFKFGDARKTIFEVNNRYDIIFLDAFSSYKDPRLWSIHFLNIIKSKMKSDSLLLSYSKSTPFRSALVQLGFHAGKTFINNKDMGTVASLNKNYIQNPLSDYDFNLINTKSGIVYKDPDLNLTGEEILYNREIEAKKSNRISRTQFNKIINRD